MFWPARNCQRDVPLCGTSLVRIHSRTVQGGRETGRSVASARSATEVVSKQRPDILNFEPESSYAFSATAPRKSGPFGAAESVLEEVRSQNASSMRDVISC